MGSFVTDMVRYLMGEGWRALGFGALGFGLWSFFFLIGLYKTMKHDYIVAGTVIAVGILLWTSIHGACRAPAMWEGMANGAGGAGASVVVLAAPSWCGWSKKMAAQVPALSSGLEGTGASVRMVDDKSDEGKQLSKAHGVNGYPATLVFGANGEKKGQVGGFKPVDDLIAEIKKLL